MSNTQYSNYRRPSRSWSYGSCIYNYLCNHCLSPLMLWVRISIRVRCTPLCDKVCQWFETGWWFSLGPPVSSINKTDCNDITEILLKVALNTIKQTKNNQIISFTLGLFHVSIQESGVTSVASNGPSGLLGLSEDQKRK